MKLQKLTLLPESGHLVVALWTFGLSGWNIARSEKVAVPGGDPLAEQLLSAIRPLAVKWAVAPETPVLVVAPTGLGGVLHFSCPRVSRRDLDALIDHEMAKSLPFSPKELERGYHATAVGKRWEVSVFWLPRSWVAEMKTVLARAGLRLAELFHRAQLIGVAFGGENPANPWGCVEQDGDGANLHFYHHNIFPQRSRNLAAIGTDSSEDELARQLALDLIALGSAGHQPSVVYAAGAAQGLAAPSAPHGLRGLPGLPRLRAHSERLDSSQLLLALWNKGGSGIWLAPDKTLVTPRLIPPVIVLVLAALFLAGAVWWEVTRLQDETQTLEAEIKRRNPHYQKALLTGRELDRARQEQGRIDDFASSALVAPPLEVLAEITSALPSEAWLVAFRYGSARSGNGVEEKTGKDIEIEGYGVNSQELGEILQKGGKFSAIAPLGASLAKDEARRPFALRLRWGGSQ